jgi:arylsulfatase A-like enzyme
MKVVDRVVVVALDGMRADLLGPETTPVLWALRGRADLFLRARSVFPSYTRVCTASVMTGALPERHGIVGNAFHHPAAGPGGALHLDRAEDVRRLLRADGAGILGPTLDAVLARAGRRMGLVNGNSAGTAMLMLPDPAAGGHWAFNPHGRGTCAMPEAWDEVVARFGPPPAAAVPLVERTGWLAHVFAEHVLGQIDPDVAFLWLAEPDTSLHYLGTAHRDLAVALRAADAAVGTVLDAITRAGRAESTAVLVFSDHGQISCPDQLPMESWAAIGIGVEPGPGIEAVAVPGRCGGITLLPGGDRAARLAALAARLLARPEIGMLFSRGGAPAVPGTLPYAAVGLDHPRAPDLVHVLADGDGPDDAGLPGQGWTVAGDVPRGGGMHGGLHPGELGNLLMLAVPGAREARREAPAGLVDVAPTILGLLGLEAPAEMIGRNLTTPDPAVLMENHGAGTDGFRQAVEVARVGRASYVLSGAGRGQDG